MRDNPSGAARHLPLQGRHVRPIPVPPRRGRRLGGPGTRHHDNGRPMVVPTAKINAVRPWVHLHGSNSEFLIHPPALFNKTNQRYAKPGTPLVSLFPALRAAPPTPRAPFFSRRSSRYTSPGLRATVKVAPTDFNSSPEATPQRFTIHFYLFTFPRPQIKRQARTWRACLFAFSVSSSPPLSCGYSPPPGRRNP